jgi:hypothetical protein
MKADPALPGSDLYPQSKGDPGTDIYNYVSFFRKRHGKIIIYLPASHTLNQGILAFLGCSPPASTSSTSLQNRLLFLTRAFHFFQLYFACLRTSDFVMSKDAGIDPGAGKNYL